MDTSVAVACRTLGSSCVLAGQARSGCSSSTCGEKDRRQTHGKYSMHVQRGPRTALARRASRVRHTSAGGRLPRGGSLEEKTPKRATTTSLSRKQSETWGSLHMTSQMQARQSQLSKDLVEMDDKKRSPSTESARSHLPQRIVSLVLSVALSLGPLSTFTPAHATDNPEVVGAAGLQDGVNTLLDATKDISNGHESAESVVNKAQELKENASAAIEGAKEKSNKVRQGAATLVEAAKDGPGGRKEAEQVAQKADELKARTSEGVSATLKQAAKVREGAKLLAEAAQIGSPGEASKPAENASSNRGKETEGKSGSGSGSEGTKQQRQGSGGFAGLFREKLDAFKEGLAKTPEAISKGSQGAVKEEAPAGVEKGVRGAVKEGVTGSVKEGLSGAVTGGLGGGVMGSVMGAAKGAVSGALDK